jgi:hypothetical protein
VAAESSRVHFVRRDRRLSSQPVTAATRTTTAASNHQTQAGVPVSPSCAVADVAGVDAAPLVGDGAAAAVVGAFAVVGAVVGTVDVGAGADVVCAVVFGGSGVCVRVGAGVLAGSWVGIVGPGSVVVVDAAGDRAGVRVRPGEDCGADVCVAGADALSLRDGTPVIEAVRDGLGAAPLPHDAATTATAASAATRPAARAG